MPFLDRSRGLLYDVGVGYLYRVLPASLRVGLPPIGDRWGGFDESRRCRDPPASAGRAGRERRKSRDRGNGSPAEDGVQPLPTNDPSERSGSDTLFPPRDAAPRAVPPAAVGTEYGNAETIDGIQDDSFNVWGRSPLLVDQALQRHLLQVGYTDRLLGSLLQRLKTAGLYNRAMIVVTADHGASFKAGDYRRTVDRRNVADIAPVPLFVKYPGQRRGVKDERDAKTIDIVPTIADVIGVQLPWKVDGRSLRGAPMTGRRVMVFKRAGRVVEANADDVHAGVLATARRNAGLFGIGGEPDGPIGPHRELVGRAVGTVASTTERGPPRPARRRRALRGRAEGVRVRTGAGHRRGGRRVARRRFRRSDLGERPDRRHDAVVHRRRPQSLRRARA